MPKDNEIKVDNGKKFTEEESQHPPGIVPKEKTLWEQMRRIGCQLADAKSSNGKEDGFQNRGDTLVFIIPSKVLRGNNLRWMLYAFAKMKPDEISVVKISNKAGFSTIVRMWWD